MYIWEGVYLDLSLLRPSKGILIGDIEPIKTMQEQGTFESGTNIYIIPWAVINHFTVNPLCGTSGRWQQKG
eukprot:14713304-Ditylum_brightwellii.AAC.1